MAVFQYKALDAENREVTGSMEAATEKLVTNRLKEMGLRPFEVVEKKDSGAGKFGGGVKDADIAQFTRQMATLLDAGLPLLRALNILADQTEKPKFKEVLTALGADIQGGASFSEALGKHKKIFSNLYINMVKAGEVGGVLETVMDRLATFAEKDMELRTKVKGAMTYPVIMAVIAVGVVSFLMIAVIPTFASMFEKMGIKLPGITLFVMGVSNFMTGYWWLIIIMGVGAFFAYRYFNHTDRMKYQIDQAKLKIPVFGDLMLKVAVGRFTRTLGTLITSGVPILQGVKIVKDTIDNEVLAKVMDEVAASISEGETISKPLHHSKVFPTMVSHMIAVGEETGALDNMLIKIADNYDMIVDETVSALSSMIEPFMIVFMGAAVGVIVCALFLPMFEILGHV